MTWTCCSIEKCHKWNVKVNEAARWVQEWKLIQNQKTEMVLKMSLKFSIFSEVSHPAITAGECSLCSFTRTSYPLALKFISLTLARCNAPELKWVFHFQPAAIWTSSRSSDNTKMWMVSKSFYFVDDDDGCCCSLFFWVANKANLNDKRWNNGRKTNARNKIVDGIQTVRNLQTTK